MALDRGAVSVSLVRGVSDEDIDLLLGGLTDRERELAEIEEIRERLLAFRRLRSPANRHSLKTAICARGLRSDEADRSIVRMSKRVVATRLVR